MDTPNKPTRGVAGNPAKGSTKAAGAGDENTADKLAQGLTLVPYWGYSPDGRRIACCAWVKLKAGESISAAASRLSAACAGRNSR